MNNKKFDGWMDEHEGWENSIRSGIAKGPRSIVLHSALIECYSEAGLTSHEIDLLGDGFYSHWRSFISRVELNKKLNRQLKKINQGYVKKKKKIEDQIEKNKWQEYL